MLSNAKSDKQRVQKPRRARRRRSDLELTVRCMGMMAFGRVHDISTAGAAIDLDRSFPNIVGSFIRIECSAISYLEGHVKWQRNSRIGVEFDPNTNAVAKVNAYFKFFHREVVIETR